MGEESRMALVYVGAKFGVKRGRHDDVGQREERSLF